MTGDIVVDGLPYPILIADDASATLPRIVGSSCRSAVVIFDARLEARARAIAAALADVGVEVRGRTAVTVNAMTKRSSTVAALYDALLDARADRQTWLVAIGGGTLTDVAGFAAATFLRGIEWAAVPTTVLGMADAAIGGKTAIDLPQGKNLVGAFWPPSAVAADIASLASLGQRDRATGLAEIVKCAVIAMPVLLDEVDRISVRSAPKEWKEIIAAAARVKARVVADDPRESGGRAVLNLGHTVGHALESASAYAIAHGSAVAIGMRAAGLLARRRGWWPPAEHARMLASLVRAGLPLFAQELTLDAVMAAMERDKKSIDGRIRFVLPVRLGEVRHGIELDGSDVREAVAAIFDEPPPAELRP
jgi:3-dehydroquinate synthase